MKKEKKRKKIHARVVHVSVHWMMDWWKHYKKGEKREENNPTLSKPYDNNDWSNPLPLVLTH